MSPLDHKSKPRGGADDLPPEIDLEDEAIEEIAEPVGPDVAFTAIDWTPHAGDAEGMVGAEVIQTLVKRLPNAPGVYRMMNAAGDVLYVGKARSLKKRVTNYAQGRFHTNRIGRMVRETSTMEFVVTRTEIEALLLEANLIKRLRPRFNVLMRDDKSFPYILLTGDHVSPGIYKHRGARSRKGDYFGPFASAGAVGRTINSLQRAFLLRSCTNSFYENRTRPCLLYQIKRCAGPCTGEISHEGYAELVDEAKDFLSGRSQKVKTEISAAMQQASQALDFERAAIYRDRLAALSHVQSHQGINPATVDEADVFAIHQEGGQVCIQVFFFRTGQNWGNRAYFPKADPALEGSEVLGSFLAQFYDDKPTPRAILLSQTVEDQELLAEALSTRAGRKVTISVPQRGEKKDLTDNALQNAREALGRRLAETSTQARLLAGFAETFGLAKPPVRIEVYDNSHIMGTNAVGAMVVAGPEGFVKNQYRKFNIRSTEITPGDDFGMMREVMERRFSRLLKEHGDVVLAEDAAGGEAAAAEAGDDIEDDISGGFPAWPDVILIDGGQGQMTAVRKILSDLGIEDRVVAIGIAKGQDRDAGRERFFVKGRDSFSLPVRDPVLYFVQRLRDEVHRFAIGSHRARRKKEMVKSPLDEIVGIGPGRKRALLLHFGTAKAVSRAAVEDLRKVDGISEQVAKLVYNHFHES
ncbi:MULTISPECIES: excinuclease ABC subunit UvrC [unclassified Mesorhizobium]|uniref:excinuclease ABC subunit UvrC n=1 Tax=unclassified Mesorhizobium TaxID=325217 RepID=UPI000FD7F66E|nr:MULTISPECIES: excinuclease ABC subunit UvrC [unclassified Mesorhizobium]TGR58670.1 excinuclease ABC subunit UvrC [bacterium M00.F.Ca.ET.199.01.1.1]TGU41221.1 excinuclease ABC subunit UvrC [bacterium M00.F.Ca.ET.156.01.1.1]TGV90536.1 excinuclease ABC subunit UvrC [Mesorhizobium sp. M00.F.Ca.ET.149.01.1.1]TGR33421.1 excinuclease ABC subunit UvrC [Mesorhizobium sp. M8A.F.Ca.ET.197.01.1.1]TGR35058.1 excinuclease ABC subunit UvrC [Mesorhizobium sp. M8A.F.Ca.ET.202.01.1.1]